MADIRISKLIKQFNIGLGDLVDFLRRKGVDVEENPNAKVSDEYLPDLQKQFGKDKEALEQGRSCRSVALLNDEEVALAHDLFLLLMSQGHYPCQPALRYH